MNPAVQVVGSQDRAHEGAELIGRLVRGRGPAQTGDCAAARFLHERAQASRRLADRLRPADGRQSAVFSDHRLGDAPLAVSTAPAVARNVADPGVVHPFVLSRRDALDLSVLRPDALAAAHAAEGAGTLGFPHLPHARGEAVFVVRERAHGADVDDVARDDARHGQVLIDPHLGAVAALRPAEFRSAVDLLGEADAPGAVHAAVHLGLDEGADLLLWINAPELVRPADRLAVGHRLILQGALAALIAHRTIERVVLEQELEDPFLRLDDARGHGTHHHALGRRRGAGGLEFGYRPAVSGVEHFHETGPALAHDGEVLVVAKVRNVRADAERGLQDGQALVHRDALIVEYECYLLIRHLSPLPHHIAAGYGLPSGQRPREMCASNSS